MLNQIKQYRTLAILDEAYHLTYGLKRMILRRTAFALFIAAAILIPLSMLIKYVQIHYGLSNVLYHTVNFGAMLVAITAAVKVWVPAIIVGVRRSIGLTIDIEEIKLACFMEKQTILKLSFIYTFLSGVFASLLLLFPGYSASELIFKFGLYVLISFIVTPITFFAFPLIITKKLTAFAALSSAYKNVYMNWTMISGPIIFINILFPVMLGSLSLLQPHISPLFGAILHIIISLLAIWLIPMMSTLGGILFRDTYGLTQRKISTD